MRLAQDLGGPILAVDASTPNASVAAVAVRPGQVEEFEPDATALPSESLAACVAGLFEAAPTSPDALSAIVVGLGPGSFTGLRVALAFVKGIAMGAEIPVYGVSSFALLAAARPGERVEILVDAQRRELYAGVYEVDGDGVPKSIVKEHLTALDRWTRDRSATITLGDVEDAVRAVPRALAGIALCEERIRRGEADPLDALVPRYLKVSEAERNLGR